MLKKSFWVLLSERKIFGIPKQPEMDADCRDLLANERSEDGGRPGQGRGGKPNLDKLLSSPPSAAQTRKVGTNWREI